MIVQGTTRVTVIIGHPIAQVASPKVFNQHFAERGSDQVMIPADIAPEQLASFLLFLRGWHNCDGCVVTMPHKQGVMVHLDDVGDRAARLGAVNVIRRASDGRLSGDDVDGAGFTTAARAHGFDPAGRSAFVIGAGGVGSAIAEALCAEKASEVTIVDIDANRAKSLRQMLSKAFPAVHLPEAHVNDLRRFDLVANASPVGSHGMDGLPVSKELANTIRSDALVAEVVTQPVMTAFLQSAQHLGCALSDRRGNGGWANGGARPVHASGALRSGSLLASALS